MATSSDSLVSVYMVRYLLLSTRWTHVSIARRAEALGSLCQGRLRGLFQPTQVGFVMSAEGFSPAAAQTT
jgi:hypothetical protein